MTQQTKIEWTDFTVNFWEGCQKVGPGCDHCYAEARDVRFTGGTHWGPGAPRRKVKGGIAKLRKINREAPAFHTAHGHWPRVFCSSLSDVFDKAVDLEWLDEAFEAMDEALDTRIQLLTKRIGNVIKRIPTAWHDGGWPAHVGLMITVVNQAEAYRDIPKLLDLKARLGIPWVGLSMEPLLGPVDLTRWTATANVTCKACGKAFWLHDADPCSHAKWGAWTLACPNCGDCRCKPGGGKSPFPTIPNDWIKKAAGRFDHIHPTIPLGSALDWVIVGGESGHNARPMHPDWVRSLRDQCDAAGTPFLFKQWGEWADQTNTKKTGSADHIFTASGEVLGVGVRRFGLGMVEENWQAKGGAWMSKTGKARAGRLLDGRTWDGVPT
tara:strand:- start:229 stop:1371 length:1143 start_codon:yes stop_codon:yes gene_type:complete